MNEYHLTLFAITIILLISAIWNNISYRRLLSNQFQSDISHEKYYELKNKMDYLIAGVGTVFAIIGFFGYKSFNDANKEVRDYIAKSKKILDSTVNAQNDSVKYHINLKRAEATKLIDNATNEAIKRIPQKMILLKKVTFKGLVVRDQKEVGFNTYRIYYKDLFLRDKIAMPKNLVVVFINLNLESGAPYEFSVVSKNTDFFDFYGYDNSTTNIQPTPPGIRFSILIGYY